MARKGKLRRNKPPKKSLKRQKRHGFLPQVVFATASIVVIILLLSGVHKLGVHESLTPENQQSSISGPSSLGLERDEGNGWDETYDYIQEIEELVSQTLVLNGSAFNSSPYGGICPVRLPADYRFVEFWQGTATESWLGYSDLECRAAAGELLTSLKEDGFMLVKAGFLDLSKEAWGCVVQAEDNSAFIIALVPEKKSFSGNMSGSGGALKVTVVHIKTPEAVFLEEEE